MDRSHGHSCDHVTFLSCWLSKAYYKHLYINALCWYRIAFSFLCGHMVTVVTVTAFCRILDLAGRIIKAHREKPMGNRERNGTFLLFAYTQMIVCLQANDCAPVRKFKRISKQRTIVNIILFGIINNPALFWNNPALLINNPTLLRNTSGVSWNTPKENKISPIEMKNSIGVFWKSPNMHFCCHPAATNFSFKQGV